MRAKTKQFLEALSVETIDLIVKYEHFCDKMLDELSFESFYDIAKELKLINEEPYDSDKHGDNYDAQEGESVIVKCK